MQRAAQITALVVLLLSSCVVALQDTNLKVDWNALNSTGEVKFFGSAVIDGTTLVRAGHQRRCEQPQHHAPSSCCASLGPSSSKYFRLSI
jgi:hypothetical protein